MWKISFVLEKNLNKNINDVKYIVLCKKIRNRNFVDRLDASIGVRTWAIQYTSLLLR